VNLFSKTVLLSGLVFCALGYSAGNKTRPDSLKSPSGAMLRSLAVPGWGQWYNGKKLKTVLVAGGEIGLVADAIIQNQLAARAQTDIDRLFYRDNRSLAIWWLAAAILYSMADAYVDAHMYHFDESPELSQAPILLHKKAPALYPPAIGIKISFALGG
jgi:hypothetical protein